MIKQTHTNKQTIYCIYINTYTNIHTNTYLLTYCERANYATTNNPTIV